MRTGRRVAVENNRSPLHNVRPTVRSKLGYIVTTSVSLSEKQRVNKRRKTRREDKMTKTRMNKMTRKWKREGRKSKTKKMRTKTRRKEHHDKKKKKMKDEKKNENKREVSGNQGQGAGCRGEGPTEQSPQDKQQGKKVMRVIISPTPRTSRRSVELLQMSVRPHYEYSWQWKHRNRMNNKKSGAAA